jgi:hypothetical protein
MQMTTFDHICKNEIKFSAQPRGLFEVASYSPIEWWGGDYCQKYGHGHFPALPTMLKRLQN